MTLPNSRSARWQAIGRSEGTVRPRAGGSAAGPRAGVGHQRCLIRVRRTGICGTDLHIHAWDAWARRHDAGAARDRTRVRRRGRRVRRERQRLPASATLVSGEGHLVCGRCRNCMAGRRHLCAHTRGVGVNRPGAFAEFVALPMTNVWHHAPGSTATSPRSSTRSATPSIPRSRFPCSARTC